MTDIFYPIQEFADLITSNLLKLGDKPVFAGAVNYFIYDTIKIFILLMSIIFFFSFIRTYLPPEKIKKILASRFEFLGNIMASLIGIVTPFCSCSAVPLFIGFVESGVPLGVTFSFLIASPMINEVGAVLLLGLFGWKIALIYVFSGVIISVVVGFILGRMRLERYVEDYVWKIKTFKTMSKKRFTAMSRARKAWHETRDIVKKVYPFVVLGVAVGALLHGYAPQDLLARIAGKGNFFRCAACRIDRYSLIFKHNGDDTDNEIPN